MNSTSNVVFGKKSRVQKCGEWARAHPLKAASIALLLVLLAIVVIIEGWALYKRYPFQIPSATVTTVVAQPNTKAAEPAKPEKAEAPKPSSNPQVLPPGMDVSEENLKKQAATKGTAVAAAKPQDVPDARRELAKGKSSPAKAEKKKEPKAPSAAPAKAAKSASQPVLWNRWGAAPFGHSFEEACRKLPQALEFYGWDKEVKEEFKQLLGPDCKGGIETYLSPHMILEGMMSNGPQGPHLLRKVEVAALPVRQGPDGHAYRKDTVFQTAKVRKWVLTLRGKTYELYLPYVCFNWAWAYGSPPKIAEEECVEVRYNTQEGDIVMFAILGEKQLPPSRCFALKAAGDSEFRTPPVHCPLADCDFSAIVAYAGMERQHSGGYRAHAGENIFRFPSVVATRNARFLEAFCLKRDGRQTMGVGIRWVHYLEERPKRAIIYGAPDSIPRGLPQDYDLAWRWLK